MTIDTKTLISISEANQNFSKVARLVDEYGSAVILKNNIPRYLVIDFSKAEQETYEYLNRKLPGVGDIVTLPDGMKGEVSGVNVLRQLVKVLVDVNDEKEMRECPVEELKFKPKHKKEKGKEKKKDRNSSGEQASSEEAK